MSILGKRNAPESSTFFDSDKFSSFIDRAPNDVLLKIYFINQFELNKRVAKKKKKQAKDKLCCEYLAYTKYVQRIAEDVLVKLVTSYEVYHAFIEVSYNNLRESARITNELLAMARDRKVVQGPAADYSDLIQAQTDEIRCLKDSFDYSVEFALADFN